MGWSRMPASLSNECPFHFRNLRKESESINKNVEKSFRSCGNRPENSLKSMENLRKSRLRQITPVNQDLVSWHDKLLISPSRKLCSFGRKTNIFLKSFNKILNFFDKASNLTFSHVFGKLRMGFSDYTSKSHRSPLSVSIVYSYCRSYRWIRVQN